MPIFFENLIAAAGTMVGILAGAVFSATALSALALLAQKMEDYFFEKKIHK